MEFSGFFERKGKNGIILEVKCCFIQHVCEIYFFLSVNFNCKFKSSKLKGEYCKSWIVRVTGPRLFYTFEEAETADMFVHSGWRYKCKFLFSVSIKIERN